MSSLGVRPSTIKPEKETRLALVLNGGVSLAVWMGVYELDLLRRDDSAQDIREEDRPVFNHWKRLADAENQRVSIDIVAGTSADGLNGMLLATAITRGMVLSSPRFYLRDMWQEAVALDDLLQPHRPQHSLAARGGLRWRAQCGARPYALWRSRMPTHRPMIGRPFPVTLVPSHKPGFRDSWPHAADRRDGSAGQRPMANAIRRREPKSAVTRLRPERVLLMHRTRQEVDVHPPAALEGGWGALMAAPRRLAVDHPRSCAFQADRQYRHRPESAQWNRRLVAGDGRKEPTNDRERRLQAKMPSPQPSPVAHIASDQQERHIGV
jgi:hypothetical protein